ncbi:alcohol dehydrogenase [compost metagenome]|uniref:zinc-binding dehydrogenase n=1 Tax=Achromobacter sp. Root83 TaxID=1736602 RepID=UPI00070B4F89|nr:alcohol dehydrogenase catalytic domain-containing protein [Achromobacter sp. Root83]KRC70139.1 alcohol dehydrogenase [Achromobacter sp. Root83]
MKATYRAMQVAQPGILQLIERPTPSPGTGEVLIAVEACGICGADVGDIERPDAAMPLPRVPGHEVVGRIAAIGESTPSMWKVGQRVGVGRLGGHCNECVQCRQGNFQLCLNQPVVGRSRDGGYAEMMLARSTGLVAIPDELSSEEAAPILCAGIATFNALKKCGAQAGDVVAILGIGGLGHLAVQYARRMGFKVVAVGRGQDIVQDVMNLGAHVYVDTSQQDTGEALKRLGGAAAVVTTISNPAAVASALAGLAPKGRLVVLGAGKDELAVPAGFLVGGERRVMGSITGTPYENERALQFSVLAEVHPRIELMALEEANEAYQRMKSGKAKFRMVLTVAADS